MASCAAAFLAATAASSSSCRAIAAWSVVASVDACAKGTVANATNAAEVMAKVLIMFMEISV